MMRLQILQRGWCTILFLAGTLLIVTAMTLIEPHRHRPLPLQK